MPANPGSIYHIDYLKNAFSDFARLNLYRVNFKFNDLYDKENQEKVEMSAKNIGLPSFNISKTEIKRMGQRLCIPSGQSFEDIQMTLFCDSEYTQRYFLHNWIKDNIYNIDNNSLNSRGSLICDITISQLNNNFDPIFTAVFERAWPTSLGEIQFSYDSDAQIVEFPCTFTYSTYNYI